MSHKVRIRRIGNALAVLLPESTLEGFGIYDGDLLFVQKTKDGIKLTHQDPQLIDSYLDIRSHTDFHHQSFEQQGQLGIVLNEMQ